MKKYKNIFKGVMATLLILFLFSMVLLNVITPSRKFSESENRILEQRPKFSFEKLVKGKFTSNFEKYIADQFPLRDFFIGVKSSFEKFLGKKENNGVYLCDDGFLMQSFKKPSDDEFNSRIKAINSFSNSLPNINKYFMLIPNSTKILEDKLPSNAPVDNQLPYIQKVRSSLSKDINFVDIYNDLYSKKNEYIFYKTDHHWTSKGAFYAYNRLISDMGLTPHSTNYFDIKKVSNKFYGSLYSKSGFRNINPDSIDLYIPKSEKDLKVWYQDTNKTFNSLYDMDNLKKKDKYTVFFNGNHPLIKITTNEITETTSSNGKLLVIKDSFANSLLPFLVSHFNEIYVVDLRYYSESLDKLIKSNNIQNVLITYNTNSFFQDKGILSLKGTVNK